MEKLFADKRIGNRVEGMAKKIESIKIVVIHPLAKTLILRTLYSTATG